MEKSGFSSRKIANNQSLQLEDITSLTVSNYGNTNALVTVNGITRKVLAFNPVIGVPFGSFNIPGDGTYSTIEIAIEFPEGPGEVILDYRKIQRQSTQC